MLNVIFLCHLQSRSRRALPRRECPSPVFSIESISYRRHYLTTSHQVLYVRACEGAASPHAMTQVGLARTIRFTEFTPQIAFCISSLSTRSRQNHPSLHTVNADDSFSSPPFNFQSFLRLSTPPFKHVAVEVQSIFFPSCSTDIHIIHYST